jgi:hypothetical protein
MKKIKTRIFALLFLIMFILPSCATVIYSSQGISKCQKTKPAKGQPAREIRVLALVADILWCAPVFVPIDFITRAIYKPCTNK